MGMKISGPLIALVLFVLLAVQIHQQWQKLPLQALNANLAYMDFEGMFALEQGERTACSQGNLNKWRRYFEQVTRLMPGMADAWGMLGFCYFHLGQQDKAVETIKKAIAINPNFWGFYYNLGVIYLQQNNFEQAAENFQKALSTAPQLNALFIKSSKIYSDIIRQSKHQDIDLGQRLEDGYKLSFIGTQGAGNLTLRLF